MPFFDPWQTFDPRHHVTFAKISTHATHTKISTYAAHAKIQPTPPTLSTPPMLFYRLLIKGDRDLRLDPFTVYIENFQFCFNFNLKINKTIIIVIIIFITIVVIAVMPILHHYNKTDIVKRNTIFRFFQWGRSSVYLNIQSEKIFTAIPKIWKKLSPIIRERYRKTKVVGFLWMRQKSM